MPDGHTMRAAKGSETHISWSRNSQIGAGEGLQCYLRGISWSIESIHACTECRGECEEFRLSERSCEQSQRHTTKRQLPTVSQHLKCYYNGPALQNGSKLLIDSLGWSRILFCRRVRMHLPPSMSNSHKMISISLTASANGIHSSIPLT